MSLKTIHPDQLTVVGTTQLETLGALRFNADGKKAYRYCKAAESILQADCIYQQPLGTLYNIVKDQSDDIPLVAGVVLYSIASSSYGWVLVAGYHANVRSMNDIALKDALVGSSDSPPGTDGECDGDDTTNKEHLVFGFALGAVATFVDDNDTSLDGCAAMLHNCLYKP